MATVLGTVNLNGCNYQLAYDLLGQYSSSNQSNVRLYGILNVTNNYIEWTRGSASVHISGLQEIGTRYEKGSHTLITRDFTFTHDDKGEFSAYIGASLSTTFVSGDTGGTLTLPKIQRYFSKTPKISIKNTTTTTITFKWETSETCNWVRYHLDGSSDWVDVFSDSATSGEFTVSGLKPNETHTIYAECRRADSGLWSNSNTSSFTMSDKTIRLKVNGAYMGATPYIKVNGTWRKATTYLKINESWKGVN